MIKKIKLLFKDNEDNITLISLVNQNDADTFIRMVLDNQPALRVFYQKNDDTFEEVTASYAPISN